MGATWFKHIQGGQRRSNCDHYGLGCDVGVHLRTSGHVAQSEGSMRTVIVRNVVRNVVVRNVVVRNVVVRDVVVCHSHIQEVTCIVVNEYYYRLVSNCSSVTAHN
jgi:hypothetical protein